MNYHGMIPLLKPKGMTSHDCVIKLRKLLKTKKIGHAGTLDPQVEGVLPICVGKATKIVDYLHEFPKTYVGQVKLGYATTTEDQTGEVTERVDVVTAPTQKEIETVLQSFLGEIEQTPPLYSAVKVKGKKLYEYARAHIQVDRPVRKVTIYELKLCDEPVKNDDMTVSFSFQVTCSKGTYVRTLAVEIGKKLGFPAHMSYLKRIKSGPFTIEDSYTFSQIEQAVEDGTVEALIYPIEKGIEHIPKIVVDAKLEKKVKNGAIVNKTALKEFNEERIALYNNEGKCLAIYCKHPQKPGSYKPEKMFITQ